MPLGRFEIGLQQAYWNETAQLCTSHAVTKEKVYFSKCQPAVWAKVSNIRGRDYYLEKQHASSDATFVSSFIWRDRVSLKSSVMFSWSQRLLQFSAARVNVSLGHSFYGNVTFSVKLCQKILGSHTIHICISGLGELRLLVIIQNLVHTKQSSRVWNRIQNLPCYQV